MISKEAIIIEIRERFANVKKSFAEVANDMRTPAFNQELGYHDALGELLEWIEDNDNA